MSNDTDGFDLGEALESNGAVQTIRTVLGLRQEAHVCPECNMACERSHTHNPQTAAFDGGACPSWECPECDTHYVRETDDGMHTLDLYGHGRE